MNQDAIIQMIGYARSNNCSDLHLTVDLPPVFRKNGQIFVSNLEYDWKAVEEAILSMLDEEQKARLEQGIDVDFAYALPTGERQRVNVYHQKGSLCAAVRILNDKVPGFEELGLPEVIERLSREPRGLILVTGPTGSGKSTTLAAMIDYINSNRKCHIITAEEPIEYLHRHKNSIIHQREVGVDVASFEEALRGALREDPDVILVGEMRDLETISAAVTAAETGHLVLSTLHTTGAASTIDRIIDVFPPHSQSQIRTQLSSVLKGIITQQLIPLADGSGRVAAFEVLVGTDGILNLIRENKAHQINSALQTGAKEGMCTLDFSLAQLVNSGRITLESAIEKASNKNELMQYLK